MPRAVRSVDIKTLRQIKKQQQRCVTKNELHEIEKEISQKQSYIDNKQAIDKRAVCSTPCWNVAFAKVS